MGELAAGVLGWRSFVWVSSWAGLVLGYLGIILLPGSAGVDLVFESVVMGLGLGSSWADMSLAFTWANQTLGTLAWAWPVVPLGQFITGMGWQPGFSGVSLKIGTMGSGLALGQAWSLGLWGAAYNPEP